MNRMVEVSMEDERPRPARARLRLVRPGGDANTGGHDDGGRLWYSTPLLLLLSGPVVLALILLDAPTWIRVAPVLAYIAVVPGLACVRLIRLPERLMEVLLGVGLSFALGVLVAQVMIYLHVWSPTLGLSTLVVIASLTGTLELYRGPHATGTPGEVRGEGS